MVSRIRALGSSLLNDSRGPPHKTHFLLLLSIRCVIQWGNVVQNATKGAFPALWITGDYAFLSAVSETRMGLLVAAPSRGSSCFHDIPGRILHLVFKNLGLVQVFLAISYAHIFAPLPLLLHHYLIRRTMTPPVASSYT